MKKYIIILTGLLLWSCQDYLLEEPKALAVSSYYNTPEEVKTGINSIYAGMADGIYFYMFSTWMDSWSDVQYGLGSFLKDYQEFNSTNLTRINGWWSKFYLTIRDANIVLENIPNASECTDQEKAAFTAEAKFLRALSYFHLVRNWGGVIIRTEENYKEVDVIRSSEADVWKLILSDLKYAEENLPDETTEAGRPSKWAAKSVMADVYFYQGLNQEASEKAREVINSGQYSLVQVNTWEDFISNLYGSNVINSSEEIFYFKYTDEGTSNQSIFFILLNSVGSGYSGGRGNAALRIESTSNFYNEWDDEDIRKELLYPLSSSSTVLLSRKFIDPDIVPGSFSGIDFPLYRYADVLLLYAEASCRANNGPTEEGLEALNMVHRRAYGKVPTEASDIDFKLDDYDYDSFNSLVLNERSYETLTEGKRWMDLKRLGYEKLNKMVYASKGITVNENLLLWPIPTTEFGYNNALDPDTDQNPGY
uniref:RagB/SusD family nutrient uptake outer membrane protein n=1 Tax=uncultured Draconibacterium sp. TaxID=1573823 RepID=UPI003216AC9D